MENYGYALDRSAKENLVVAWKIMGTHSGPPDKNTMESLDVLTSDGWKTFAWSDIFLRRRSETLDGTLKRLKEQCSDTSVEVL